MTRSLDVTPRPAAAVPVPLIAVDRAAAELRRGGIVAVCVGDTLAAYALAAEAATPDALQRLAALAGRPLELAVTGRRAAVLGLAPSSATVFAIAARGGFDAETVAALADPCAEAGFEAGRLSAAPAIAPAAAAVALAKLARLLPAVVTAEIPSGVRPSADVLCADADAIIAYQQTAARTLTIVGQARVPLEDAENARIVAFRPADGGVEHLAIVIGEPDCDVPVLARLHSECFTGDLLGSLRCDCGDQLRGAIAEISAAGSGVLLYLAQEGRGIGLVNKLRAYQLQDQGFDTLDANLQLGFDDDERIYQPAAQMLRLLGIGRVRLLTNNPMKVDALAAHGIEVTERVPHVFPANDHNKGYLRTKATRGGHLF